LICGRIAAGENYNLTHDTWAAGHLIRLKDPEDVDEKYKHWSLENLPLPYDNGLKVMPAQRGRFKIIKELIHRPDVDCLINAGDAGREGLLIQSWIYQMAGNKLPVKLLWASSLTDQAIKEAFGRLHDEQEAEFVNLLREAETRAVADQIYGYNYTRLLTLLYGGRGTVLSYGRCQTPLLNLVYTRDQEYEKFKPQPYWTIVTTYNKGFSGTEINEEGKVVKYLQKDEADQQLIACKNQPGIVQKCQKEKKQNKAPALFNLSELQSTLGKKYGYTPDKTLEIAQKLYDTYKIMSYPRTDSRYLSTDLYHEIGEHIQSCAFGKFKEYVNQIDLSALKIDKAYFNDNKVSDHHALIPTINDNIESIYQRLSEEERNCFDEVVVSLLAIFLPAYCYESTEIIVKVGNKRFLSQGTTILDLGYKRIYRILSGKSLEDKELQLIPELKEGEEITLDKVVLKEDKTKPKARYTPGNITKLMGKYKIGTSATAASIIQTLMDRNFLKLEKGKYMTTDLGRKFLQLIPDELKSSELTIRFELNLQKVNKGELTKEAFLETLIEEIKKNMAVFQQNTTRIVQETSVGKCPKCGRNLKQGKSNWYCPGYKQDPVCEFSIWTTIAGKRISDDIVEELLKKRKTGLIKGFKGKNGNSFDAYLVLDSTFKVGFEFKK
ncbi:MAG: DNA topoisomerase, partial [Lachnospiraceae bacterium]